MRGIIALGAVVATLMAAAPARADDREEAKRLEQRLDELEGQGNYAQALIAGQSLLGIYEKLGWKLHMAGALSSLARLYEQLGQYELAEQRQSSALEIYRQHKSKDIGYALGRLGSIYDSQGRAHEAEALFVRALAADEKTYGPDDVNVGWSLNNLAGILRESGELDRAEALYQRSLAIVERARGNDHLDVAAVLNNLAILYYGQGRRELAERTARRALAIYQKRLGANHPLVGKSLDNLSWILRALDHDDEAERLMLRALEIRQRLGPEHPSVAVSLSNLGILYKKQRHYDKAEQAHRKAVEINERKLPGSGALASNLTNLASVYLAQKRPELAAPLLERALELKRSVHGDDHPHVAVILSHISKMHLMTGDVAAAVELRERNSDILDRHVGLAMAAGSEAKKRAYMRQLQQQTELTVSLHMHGAPDSRRAAALALRTVLRRKGTVLDSQASLFRGVRRQLDDAGRALLDDLLALRTQRANLALRGPGGGDSSVARAQISKLDGQIEERERALAARSKAFRRTGAANNVTVAEVAGGLPADSALVELVRYQPSRLHKASGWQPWRFAAYVLRPDSGFDWVDLGEGQPIVALIGELRRAIIHCPTELAAGRTCDWKRNQTAVDDASRRLDAVVMAPIRPLLGKAAHIVLSPDGELNLVPFDLLRDDSGRYLIERYRLTVVTSGRDLLRLDDQPSPQQGPTVLAAPDYDARQQGSPSPDGSRPDELADMQWPELPGTRAEANAIGQLLPQFETFTGAAASEAAVKNLRGPSVLHVATHAFFLGSDQSTHGDRALRLSELDDSAPAPLAAPEDPLLRAGLVLAGANKRSGGDQDGILTASEATAIDLLGTRLVVMSACETGVGKVEKGSGVYGLRRALVLAGATSQVMSLWQVHDEATRDLMIQYYQQLRAGQGRTEALRRAKLQLLASQRWAHPYYWAAFIPSGDWRPLDPKDLGLQDWIPIPEPKPAPVARSSRGCGCNQGRPTATVLALLLVTGLLVTRRRST